MGEALRLITEAWGPLEEDPYGFTGASTCLLEGCEWAGRRALLRPPVSQVASLMGLLGSVVTRAPEGPPSTWKSQRVGGTLLARRYLVGAGREVGLGDHSCWVHSQIPTCLAGGSAMGTCEMVRLAAAHLLPYAARSTRKTFEGAIERWLKWAWAEGKTGQLERSTGRTWREQPCIYSGCTGGAGGCRRHQGALEGAGEGANIQPSRVQGC